MSKKRHIIMGFSSIDTARGFKADLEQASPDKIFQIRRRRSPESFAVVERKAEGKAEGKKEKK